MLNPNSPGIARVESSSVTSPARFLALIADKLIAAEDLFVEALRSDVPFIENAGEYLFSSGGKRLRPAMLLLSARMLGHDSDEEITYSAVVELIHSATLIHDDIIDHASLRRGRTTINELWGNSLTVLLGDWLYTKAMKMALSHDNLEIIRRLCDATLRMTEGELLAQQKLGSSNITADEYFHITRRKTAFLFSAACSIPSLMRPAQAEADQLLQQYGLSLGTCFQLVDDLLDFTATEGELGKPVLSDLKEGKLTLPIILLLPRLQPERRRLIEMVLKDGDFKRVERKEILELVTSEGTLEEVAKMAEKYALDAKQQLSSFPECDAREAMEFAPDYVLQRRS
jgi:octaprenyl-diphosphate synthase